MSRRVQTEHPAPRHLQRAANDALDEYEGTYEQTDLVEALARIHHETLESFSDLPTMGPYAAAGPLLVYGTPISEWITLCDQLNIYERARKWSYRAMLTAARVVSTNDSHEPWSEVKKAL